MFSLKTLAVCAIWFCSMQAVVQATETTSTQIVEPLFSDKEAYRAYLIQLHNASEHDLYLEKSASFIADDPQASGTAHLIYRQMRSLRRQKKWEEARERANHIVQEYPKSKAAKGMGGKDGLTEDQAAFAFAEISKAYHSRQFDPCIRLCEEFIKNYPENWRTHDLYVYYCHALYHSGQREKFFQVGRKAIATKKVKNEGQVIQFLQAATYVKAGKFEEARRLLDALEEKGEKSPLRPEFAKLRFDSYYYENRHQELAQLAEAYADKKTTGTPDWATGKMWSAVARAHQDPPDLAGAAAALDAIDNSGVQDDKVNDHVPTHALYWRAWVAEKQGDKTKAKAVAAKIRDTMPNGPVRDKALKKLSSLLDRQGD